MNQDTGFRILVIIIIGMSAVTFSLFGIDKWKAMKDRWRIPESTLLLCALFGGGIGALPGMLVFRHKIRKWKFRILVPVLAFLQILLLTVALYAGAYYHADDEALAVMQAGLRESGTGQEVSALTADPGAAESETAAVRIEPTETGWLFDGPAEDMALIFYPGAKVEETAYAPLLQSLAASGTDVYLVKMPLRLAILGMNRADRIIEDRAYEHYYIGGHSLGGAMAAAYAAGQADGTGGEAPEHLDGVILLAAYPTKALPAESKEILIYGSEDHVLNLDKVREGDQYAPAAFTKHVMEGGNHAQFGNYGPQKGDGEALLTAREQQAETVRVIMDALRS